AKSQILSNILDVAHQFIKEVNPPNEGNTFTEASSKSQKEPKAVLLQENNSEVETKAAERREGANSRCKKPLCEMPFDEEASAQSFREAVAQWRAGHQEENKQQNSQGTKPVVVFIDSVEECEVQTTLKIWTEPINIEFTEDSLTYMEKLWLKKHRRTPQEQLQNLLPNTFPHPREATTRETQSSLEENDADSDVEEIKIQYSPLFMPVEKVNIERPPPSLTIVELDETHEAEFEEPGTTVPYRVELTDEQSQLSSTFPDYWNCFPCNNDIYQHLVFNKGQKDLSFCLRTNSSYHKDDFKSDGSSTTDFDKPAESGIYSHEFNKIEETSYFVQNVTEKNMDPGNNQNSGDSCMSFCSKGSLPTVDLDTSFIEENSSQDTRISLECTNLKERPNLEDSKTTKSPLLLKEIALRKKPINERYQGLEKFFTPDASERLDSYPSPSIGGSHSCSSITITEHKMWIPDRSLSGHADSAVALYNQQSTENPLPNMQEQKTETNRPPIKQTKQNRRQDESPHTKAGWTKQPNRKKEVQRAGKKSQRPSTANFPVSNYARKGSSCSMSSFPRPRNVVTQSLSRAASEISEIEYIDVTDQNEPFLDNTADQQSLDSLEKELNVLRNLADPSEQLQSLLSEELQPFTHHPLNLGQLSKDLLEMSCESASCETEF
ncbi:hypothetical protein STEG23_011663, partial [Scotinomys teguina]